MVVGGENLNEGVIYHSWDSGENWDFSVWDHELRDIEFYDDYQLVFGHGIIMRSFQDGERRSFVQEIFLSVLNLTMMET